ncbi:glutamate--cysteine ligase [Glaciecola sp. 2405UD65-10]|uniref:glutamate--cysteine ligase n=1 Tax=Glaciecola sp. 2405UD65-10 TaxID=3397244 RepID=UPI003B5950F5
MSNNQTTFETRLLAVSQPRFLQALKDIKHGVERETLRVNESGGIADTPHPKSLGSALTHEYITTDFSESLLEFITPPENRARTSLAQLIDIHKFTYESIGEEYLWPLSMPCFINSETKIPIANYGSSNIAKMKAVYRNGLHHRYGSMMQVISGVHFNFSLPDSFWQLWCENEGEQWNKTTQSAHYFSMIRNFRRYAWVIPYLFGASPALCSSFISHKKSPHSFKTVGKGTYYLPYATSLRMSDLGYTSSAQSSLNICYNDLDTYVSSVRKAIGQKAPEYSQFSSSDAQGWQQLNGNILQIENELYSPIRPKQIALSQEMPTNALENRGVSYLEVRSLDVNPYSPIGIEESQFHYLDVFLLYCLLEPSPKFVENCFEISQDNINKTVLEGRDPSLMLQNGSEKISLKDWGLGLNEELLKVAAILDAANETDRYSKAVNLQSEKFNDASLTASGKWLATLLDNNIDNSSLGLELAKEYKAHMSGLNYKHIPEQTFVEQAKASVIAQKEIEAKNEKPFEQFVNDYFTTRKPHNPDLACE